MKLPELDTSILKALHEMPDQTQLQLAKELDVTEPDVKEDFAFALKDMRQEKLIRINKLRYSITDKGIDVLNEQEAHSTPNAPVSVDPSESEKMEIDLSYDNEIDDAIEEVKEIPIKTLDNSEFELSFGGETLQITGHDQAVTKAQEITINTGHDVEIYAIKRSMIGKFQQVTTARFIATEAA